ncbi:hypothetical protein HPB47_020369 [Ixodes persulcatus]|uniref:Uncharacterized protein n=1 Tax=Ixodes persulcatus TaxID=34615 RepID=A0AC60QFJ1_IXOPE|nr:hypothetical protein HPB47_020369 [Ixodes persulcatus]
MATMAAHYATNVCEREQRSVKGNVLDVRGGAAVVYGLECLNVVGRCALLGCTRTGQCAVHAEKQRREEVGAAMTARKDARGRCGRRDKRDRTCFVPGCNSGYRSCKETRSLYRAPLECDRRETWSRNIKRSDRELHDGSVVCERHFESRFIQRTFQTTINGEVAEVLRERPLLTPDAVPTIFPDAPKHVLWQSEGELGVWLQTDRGTHLTTSQGRQK